MASKKKDVFVWGWIVENEMGAYLSPDKKGECGCIYLPLGNRLKLKPFQCKKYKLVEVKEDK